HQLFVAARDARAALEQIRRFEDENAEAQPPDDRLELRAGFRAGAAIWSLALAGLYVAERLGAGGLPWKPTGEAQAAAIRAGELWRALTALGLHADLAHLAGNVLFGALFVGAICQSAGIGAGLLLTLLSGALGNLAAAFLREGTGTSVGASTAVFGALGLLAALQWRRRRRRRASALRRWTPIVAAALLLGYLGASGARVDVLGHVTGFVCGLAVGATIEPRLERRPGGSAAQAAQGLVAASLVAGAWIWGFLRA
ncbi:MAG TPA: rhomboid family intramembrane serine protease, partial [Planctomycetota bacterium]|nr:rhomboid family intramembrane serine protease [Planctomycetota bacterium]